MPIVVLYKAKNISTKITDEISSELARITRDLLDAKIEVRVIEPATAYNANEIHIEMRFRDFKEWGDKQLEIYHESVMNMVGAILKENKIAGKYSFYIIPSTPPRSIWAQGKA